MTDEDVVLDHDPFANEGVTGNLATFSDGRVFLDLDERTNLGFVADLASVQVDELRQPHISAQLNIVGNTVERTHR
jgi:hypothetical protein